MDDANKPLTADELLNWKRCAVARDPAAMLAIPQADGGTRLVPVLLEVVREVGNG